LAPGVAAGTGKTGRALIVVNGSIFVKGFVKLGNVLPFFTARAGALAGTMPAPDPAQEVAAYWHGLSVGGTIPFRDEVDPRGIAGALAHVFMIERIAPFQTRFRFAGNALADLIGSDPRGMPMSVLFEPVARDRLGPVIAGLFDTPARLTLSLEAERGIGRPAMRATMALFPLRSRSGVVDLALGCLTTDGMPGRAPRRFALAGLASDPLAANVAPRVGAQTKQGGPTRLLTVVPRD
jgi:hypothetical protein